MLSFTARADWWKWNQQAAVWAPWVSCRQMGQQRKLVPFSVTSPLMVVNICSMSLPPQQSLDAGWCHWDCECQMWIFNQQAVKHRLSPRFYCKPSENTWHLFNFIWWNIFCDLSASAMLTHEFNILSNKSSFNSTEMNLKSLVRLLYFGF